MTKNRPGSGSASVDDGTLGKYNFRNLPKDKMHDIAMKSVETRRKNKAEKLQLQKCMSALLDKNVSTQEEKRILKKMGISEPDMTNKVLLMSVLFRKGLTGDVPAIKEIIGMMDKLDMYSETGSLQGDVIINLVPVGQSFNLSETQKKEIEEAQQEKWMYEDEENDEWGEEIYKG